ncbi:MAG: ABC transporter permease subunit [Chloroflexota bacterium]|nr:ABC transporter permease subunit [Chloroflexota bacterium]
MTWKAGQQGNIRIVLQKEWREFKQQRTLIISIIVLPLLLTLIPLIALFAIGMDTSANTPDKFTRELMTRNPVLAGMSEAEAAQSVMGQAFSSMFLLMPMILPSIIAAYSIVGEKTNRTLEPLLATPIKTWELLTAKMLASLIPSLALTWLAGLVFIIGIGVAALNGRVFAAIVSPG